jgi:DNA-binding CsgD family transcriptional regulator
MVAQVVIIRHNKNLREILEKNNFQDEFFIIKSYLEELKLEDACFFLYDLIADKSSYFCPSVNGMLGFDHRTYLNKGFLFFKNVIHPMDFLFFINEILVLVKSAENCKGTVFMGNNSGVLTRIKHKNGEWQVSKSYLMYLRKTDNQIIKLLLGFIVSDASSQNNFSLTPSNITTREKEVFRYLSIGNSAKMIADKLRISENTVITHRKNLIEKLQVKNSAEMIKRGIEMNILNSPSVFA